MEHKQLNPVASLVVCALLWSTGGVLIKLVSWNPLCIAGARSFIGVITLCLIMHRLPHFVVRGERGAVSAHSTADMLIGAFLYAATMLLYVPAAKLTTAANAIILQYTNSIYVILFGPLLLHEKNDWIDYGAVAGIICGMLLLFAGDIGGGSLAGNLLALASGVSYGFATMFLRRQKDGHPADSLILSHIITVLFSLPFIISSFVHGTAPADISWLGIALLGVFQVGIPSVLFSLGIAGVSALGSVVITMIEPLMNPVWVALIVHEIPSPRGIAGGIVILLCIVLHVVLKAHALKSRKACQDMQ